MGAAGLRAKERDKEPGEHETDEHRQGEDAHDPRVPGRRLVVWYRALIRFHFAEGSDFVLTANWRDMHPYCGNLRRQTLPLLYLSPSGPVYAPSFRRQRPLPN